MKHRLLTVLPLLLAAVLVAGWRDGGGGWRPPPHAPQLVPVSFFSPDSVWAVRVTSTVPYTAAGAPAYVDDATVEIWEGDRLVATPTLADSGTYVARGEGRRSGPDLHPPRRRARLPRLPKATTPCRCPCPSPPSATRRSPPFDSLSRRRLARVEITLDDPPGEANHYGLLVVQARWEGGAADGPVHAAPAHALHVRERQPRPRGERGSTS